MIWTISPPLGEDRSELSVHLKAVLKFCHFSDLFHIVDCSGTAVRDSSPQKKIAYLTLCLLPPIKIVTSAKQEARKKQQAE